MQKQKRTLTLQKITIHHLTSRQNRAAVGGLFDQDDTGSNYETCA